jgi:tRNA threonylcarbamoyladenosine biosynthesis protein TsaB
LRLLILAFDTATDVATCALVRGGGLLGERRSKAARILEDATALLAEASAEPAELEGIAVGTGPGSFTGIRMGLVTARTLSFTLDAPVAGVSTLAALERGTPGSSPVIDGRRGEVFTLVAGSPACVRAENLPVLAGNVYVGDGALRYREQIEHRGGVVPAEEDAHVPWARHHVALAQEFGPAEQAEPIYLRLPDAERALQES